MDIQLEEEIYMNGCNWSGSCTTMQRCSNCSEPGYNIRIYKKDEEMFNVYSYEWFQLIIGVMVD